MATLLIGVVFAIAGVACPMAHAADFGSTGVSWQIRASQILLDRVYSYWSSDFEVISNSQGPIYFNDCVRFTNLSNRPVIGVQVMFASVDSGDRPRFAAMPLDVRKVVPPDAAVTGMNCRDHAFGNGAGGRSLVGWVNAVTYDDGSVWHAAPAVPGSVVRSAGAPLDVRNAAIYLPLEECGDVKNLSQRAVRHVQIAFLHIGLDGAVLGEDALDLRRDISPGGVLKNACRGFRGRSVPDEYDYGYALSHALPDSTPPVIEYAGRASSLSVRVNEVDFTDGTSWHAPNI